jgi:hypothetical protein
MATDASTDRPRKKRGILFKLSIVLLVLVVLLVAAFFVVTSSAFFKGVILPKVGANLNSDITVSDASIGLSQVVLNDLKLVPHGRPQLLEAQQVRTRFSLSDIIGGKIVVHELTLQSPNITVVKNADGTSNLDPLTQKKETKPEEKKTTTEKQKENKPTQIDIANVAIKNGQVSMTEKMKTGGEKVTKVSDFNFAVDRLQNGQSGKLQISGNVSSDHPAAPGTEAGALAATLAGNFDYKLANDLSLQSAQGNLKTTVTRATGSMAELANAAINMDCNLTPTEIQNLALQFQRGGNALGELRVKGPFSVEKKEGKFTVDLLGLDKQVLNFVGSASGIDFNQTKINSTNQVEIQQGGNNIAITGNFDANQFSITKKAEKQTTPPMDLHISYQVNVDQNKQSALIQKLQINGLQNQQEILTGTLSKPMPVSWGQGAGMPEEAAFNLKVNNLNLADWKAFAADLAPAGSATVNLNLISKNAGKQLALDLNTHLANFSAKFGSNQIANADIQLTAKGQVDDLKKVNLSDYKVQLAQQGQTAVTIAGSGTVDTGTKATDLKTTLQASLPQLLRIVSVPKLSITSGDVNFDGRIVQTGNTQVVNGKLGLVNLVGSYDTTKLDRLAAQMNADISMLGADVTIKQLNGNVTQADQPAGNFDVSGNWNTSNNVGKVTAKLNGFNEHALGPFLASSLGNKQLVSVQVDGSASADMQAAGSGSFNADLSVTKLLVKDPAHPSTKAPLNAHFVVDGSMQTNVLNLKQARIALSPTQRAKNELELTGMVDMSRSNNMIANLTARSEGLDVTEFYDLYSKPKTTGQQTLAGTPQPAQQTQPAANANVEPEPVRLPIQQANIELAIGHIYLHDLDLADWKGTLKISDNSHIVISPFQLTLNKAPINANIDLNLGVRGYAYNIAFSMDKVPLQPIVDTFMPEKKGAYKADIIANANIKGTGTTGTSLKNSLNGQVTFSLTNATIKITTVGWVNALLKGIAAVTQSPQVSETVLNWVAADVPLGNGQIQIKNFQAQSPELMAQSQGNIPIADVLTNSPLNLPLDISLASNLAKLSRLAPANATTNGAYTALPRFVTIVGTLGKPDSKINKVALVGTAAQAIGGFIGGKTGEQIQSGSSLLNNFLGGKPAQAPTNAPATTNAVPAQPSTQPNTTEQILKGLGGFLNKPKK